VDKYVAAFEQADLAALAALLRHDVQLQMPPVPTWFAGRDAVIGFFASRGSHSSKRRWRFVATQANGCPALGAYVRQPDGSYAPHSIQVLDTAGGEITHIYAFIDPELFPTFGLPAGL
jgi:RNA polymerase sigma-70 factor, ECF subfamily